MAFKLFSRVTALNSTRLFASSYSSTCGKSNPYHNSCVRVEHDRENKRFTISLGSEAAGSSECAVLRYKFTAEKEVDLMSTNVPESFRGKGVAALLSKAAMDFLVEENLKAHVSCWYINKYIKDNPLLAYEHLIITAAH